MSRDDDPEVRLLLLLLERQAGRRALRAARHDLQEDPRVGLVTSWMRDQSLRITYVFETIALFGGNNVPLHQAHLLVRRDPDVTVINGRPRVRLRPPRDTL